MLSAVETSHIKFRQLEDRGLHDYVRRYPVLRYAGALEGDSVLRFADSVSGSYNFVTAMPVSRLAVFLESKASKCRTIRFANKFPNSSSSVPNHFQQSIHRLAARHLFILRRIQVVRLQRHRPVVAVFQ